VLMIIVDRALAKRADEGQPVRVGMIGAGFMGRGIANQIVNSLPGMRLAAIYNRRIEKALDAYRQAGIEDPVRPATTARLDEAIANGHPAVTDDPFPPHTM
jgi:predicted homoserine dehydrogenase-like protein